MGRAPGKENKALHLRPDFESHFWAGHPELRGMEGEVEMGRGLYEWLMSPQLGGHLPRIDQCDEIEDDIYIAGEIKGGVEAEENLIADLEAIATHWSQFGASRQDAQAIRDALKMVRDGWKCDTPQHEGICTVKR